MGGFEESVMVWLDELPRSSDNLGTKTCSSAREGERFLKRLLIEA